MRQRCPPNWNLPFPSTLPPQIPFPPKLRRDGPKHQACRLLRSKPPFSLKGGESDRATILFLLLPLLLCLSPPSLLFLTLLASFYLVFFQGMNLFPIFARRVSFSFFPPSADSLLLSQALFCSAFRFLNPFSSFFFFGFPTIGYIGSIKSTFFLGQSPMKCRTLAFFIILLLPRIDFSGIVPPFGERVPITYNCDGDPSR